MSKATVMSFGFKYGLPNANYYFDVAFIKNPAREDTWNFYSCVDKNMEEYILSQNDCKDFLYKLLPLIEKLLEIDHHQIIAFGCNAGRHRSFVIAEYVYNHLKGRGYDVKIEHRDVD